MVRDNFEGPLNVKTIALLTKFLAAKIEENLSTKVCRSRSVPADMYCTNFDYS